jgi:hypothetical protein
MGKWEISGSICFFGAPEFRLSEAMMIEEMGIISCIHACSYGPFLWQQYWIFFWICYQMQWGIRKAPVPRIHRQVEMRWCLSAAGEHRGRGAVEINRLTWKQKPYWVYKPRLFSPLLCIFENAKLRNVYLASQSVTILSIIVTINGCNWLVPFQVHLCCGPVEASYAVPRSSARDESFAAWLCYKTKCPVAVNASKWSDRSGKAPLWGV